VGGCCEHGREHLRSINFGSSMWEDVVNMAMNI
jgi:hypothetical protein